MRVQHARTIRRPGQVGVKIILIPSSSTVVRPEHIAGERVHEAVYMCRSKAEKASRTWARYAMKDGTTRPCSHLDILCRCAALSILRVKESTSDEQEIIVQSMEQA